MLWKRHLPDRVRQIRKRLGWTQPELARKAMLGLSTLKRVEIGDGAGVSAEHLLSLSLALGVSPDYLLGIDKSNHHRPMVPAGVFPILYDSEPGSPDLQKCEYCDSLLVACSPHLESMCVYANYKRGKLEEWLAERYGITLECVLKYVISEQRRSRESSYR